jgi:hypothetical protein
MRSDVARRITETYSLREADRRRVLTFFGEPQQFYTIEEAATLSCTSVEEVEYHLEETIIGLEENGLLPWNDVAYVLYANMPRLLVEAAIQPIANAALPRLNHSERLTIWLPRWQLRLLDHLADRESRGRYRWTRNDALTMELGDTTSRESAGALWYDAAFHAAYCFPNQHVPRFSD